MDGESRALIDLDWDRFHPWRIQPVRHRLAAHPLLQPAQLVELGKRLERLGRVRTHSDDATPGTSFNAAPRLHPHRKSAAETLADIHAARAWMSLLNVQADPVYRALVDAVLDDIRPSVERSDPGMCYRGGWIFVTSPRTVTPFHFDKEHNFILQVQGRKTLYVWDHRDTEAASERARDRFHATHERDLLVWREELRERAQVFHLEPGQGAYMPSTSPHMVENGDGPSITMSFTYYTHATRRDSALHSLHERLRGLGIALAPVGHRPAVDAMLHHVGGSVRAVRHVLRKLAGRPVFPTSAPYAFTETY
ncbi:cupin-like domain-containing protein [Dokdonella sp.]|uniref:cupin-like domain-containing protein n=1 Tax=Dokdonella sp. TaxID=2291710 RepID=UPI0031C9F570|nr:cupin-like domain-containing protein [Dokdonella sp.]